MEAQTNGPYSFHEESLSFVPELWCLGCGGMWSVGLSVVSGFYVGCLGCLSFGVVSRVWCCV